MTNSKIALFAFVFLFLIGLFMFSFNAKQDEIVALIAMISMIAGMIGFVGSAYVANQERLLAEKISKYHEAYASMVAQWDALHPSNKTSEKMKQLREEYVLPYIKYGKIAEMFAASLFEVEHRKLFSKDKLQRQS